MPVIQPGACRINRHTELFILGPPTLQFFPIAGRQQYAVAIQDVSALDLVREGIQARVMLRPLDAVVFENFRVAGKKLPVACDLIVSRGSEQRQGTYAQHHFERSDWPPERLVDGRISRAIGDCKQNTED